LVVKKFVQLLIDKPRRLTSSLSAYYREEDIMEKSHEQKTVEAYAHDYRDMAMSQETLYDVLTGFADALECHHQCSSNCRRNGCNCHCGEYHY